MDGRTEEQKGKRTEERKGKRIEGQKDKRTEEQKGKRDHSGRGVIVFFFPLKKCTGKKSGFHGQEKKFHAHEIRIL